MQYRISDFLKGQQVTFYLYFHSVLSFFIKIIFKQNPSKTQTKISRKKKSRVEKMKGHSEFKDKKRKKMKRCIYMWCNYK